MMSPKESRIIDINSEAAGVETLTLMGNAGSKLAEVLKYRFGGKRFLFVCGSGNNGGDGFAAASLMTEEDVTVCLMGPVSSIHSEASAHYFSKLECPVIDFDDLSFEGYDVLVDCALGTGASGNIRGTYADFIALARSFNGTIVSADVPSGLGCKDSIVPDITVTFHDIKSGMTPENSGEIIIADIGVPPVAVNNVGPGDMLRYPVPAPDSHKGLNGRVLLIGGGPYCGAPAMAGLAALRTGTDIVRIAAPEKAAGTVSSFSPVLMTDPLSGNFLACDHVSHLLGISKNYDVVLIGPGLGAREETLEAVRDFVSGCPVPLIIDADAIGAVGPRYAAKVQTVITPHKREFIKLGGAGSFEEEDVRSLASSTGSVIVLKGRTDIISDGERTRKNTTGTPAMTGAGTGDVLAGIIAGLVSKGMTSFEAGCLGAYICGKAGEYGFSEKSYGLIATDVIDFIPTVIKNGLKGLK
ncbi:MAG: NAD(P)H-hydrate dehydratase [Candidatus Methanomethylophilaceae archaeon]